MSVDPTYLRDPAHVREEYATEQALADRISLYAETTGPSARDLAFDAVAEVSPRRLLEVGCGTGWFAARVARELGVDVVAVDQSERMVELARAEGVDARVGDVQELPFGDREFDCAAANWMLYHVPDLDRGLSELARVLAPGGRLVAVTVGRDHLLELWELVGAAEWRLSRDLGFGVENGAEALARHFSAVEVRDSSGTVQVQNRAAALRYLASSAPGRAFVDTLPEVVEPFTARRSSAVFVATK